MLKTTGRMAALLMITGVIGAVLFGVMRSKQAPATAPTSTTDFGVPPQVTPADAVSGVDAGSPQDLIALADEGTWTRVDPVTGRVRFKMTWERLDPEARGEFLVRRPRIWMIEDGRTLRLESSQARVVWPSRAEGPESGDLTGGVLLEAEEGEHLEGRAKASSLIGTVRTESMSFNQPLRELRAPGSIRLDAQGVVAQSGGMTLRLGSENAVPISLLRLEMAGRIEYDPRARAEAEQRAGARGIASGGPSPQANIEQFHRLTMQGDVRLGAGVRSIRGEELVLFARTIGGRLGEAAIAQFESKDRDEPSERKSRSGETERAGEPAVIAWERGLEFVTVNESKARAELGTEDVLVRVTGPAGGVMAEDSAAGGRISAGTIAYGATSRTVSALGGDGKVEGLWPDVARLECDRVDLNLTTGEGSLAGAGEVRLIEKDQGPGARGARWAERAEFSLDASAGPVGTSESVTVKGARLAGRAVLFDGGASLESDGLRAMFDSNPGAGPDAPSVLRRLSASGGAIARDARGAAVRGENVDVLFEPDSEGRPAPTLATVRGGARAEREGDSLEAELIEATIVSRDGSANIGVVDARERVVATTERDGSKVTVRAASLRADAALEQAEFAGEPVTIERVAPDGSGMLSGRSMRAEAREGAQRLTVFGAGTSRYSTRDASDRAADIEVDWSGGLIYTDATGRAEVEGGVAARLASGANERHTATGARIVIDITPAGETAAGGARELRRALIEGGGGTPAEVELRRFVAGTLAGEEGTLEGLAFLRGPSIELSGGASRLRVDGAGLLLLEDRRPAGANDAASAQAIEFKGTRGTTLFSWESGMTLDRGAGGGEMTGGVLIRHRDASALDIAEVACQRATMALRESAPGSSSLEGITLERAEALGGVTARYKTLQLESARLIYEATGRIIAASEPGGRISVYDESDGRSASGEAAIVDTATGTYRIEKLESIAIPR